MLFHVQFMSESVGLGEFISGYIRISQVIFVRSGYVGLVHVITGYFRLGYVGSV
jgi:hypothetical protein